MLLKCYGHGRKGAIYAVIDCKLKQNANEGCNSCASLAGHVLCFIACFILLVIAPLPGICLEGGTLLGGGTLLILIGRC